MCLPSKNIGKKLHVDVKHQNDAFKSIRGFLKADGDGTMESQRGHFGFFLYVITYSRHTGHPAANIPDDDAGDVEVEDNDHDRFSSSSSPSSLVVNDEESDIGGDDRFFEASFSALSRADLTLSRVQTL